LVGPDLGDRTQQQNHNCVDDDGGGDDKISQVLQLQTYKITEIINVQNISP
jgi:hypothetical protein